MGSSKKKYYAYSIPRTKEQGVVDTWEECKDKIEGESGVKYKGFPSVAEAEEWLTAGADYSFKKELPKGVYFDAGTGRGDGVEIRVTDEKGKDLLHESLDKEHITEHGTHLVGKESTNNYGELLACKHALLLAGKLGYERIFGDSALVVDYWSKGYIKKAEISPATVALAEEVAVLRKQFERNGGIVEKVSGDDNPADLGFHR